MSHQRFARGQTVEARHIYVLREEDRLFHERAIGASWFGIRGCRTMGKTSLIVRNLDLLETRDCRVIMVDVGGWTSPSVEAWLEELASQILADLAGRGQFDLDPKLAAVDLPSFLFALTQSATHTLLVLDEVDWLKELDYGRHVLARLRAAQAKLLRSTEVLGLSLCLITLDSLTTVVGASVAPIISTIQMCDFPTSGADGKQVIETLARGFSGDVLATQELSRAALAAAGGQPFQTMILANEFLDRDVRTENQTREAITAYLEEQRDNPKELLGQISDMFLEEPLRAQEALNAYEEVFRGNAESAPLGTPGVDFLLRTGLVRAKNGQLEIKGPVFRDFFNRAWVRRTRDRIFDEQRRRKPRQPRVQGKKIRLCILNTGGTVGMVRRAGRVVEPRDESEFLNNYSELQEIADIDFEQPFVRDSINVFPQQWSLIAETIYRKRNHGYTGFVVAHGTDTMAFTASAVAFALGRNLRFPVVFTGAQTTPEVLHGDSHANLVRACVVASKGRELPEVVICFGSKILRAVRAQKKDEQRFEAFDSPSFPSLGEITENIILDRERIRDFTLLRDELIRRPANYSADIDLEADFAQGVLMIQLTPGLEPDFYLPALLGEVEKDTKRHRCRGVILQTLGAGNVANMEPYSFTDFIRKVVQTSIPILITSPYPWSSDLAKGFGPAAEPAMLGAIIGGEMTAAAAASKFRWAIAKAERKLAEGEMTSRESTDYIREIMGRNYLGEKDGEFWDPDQQPEHKCKEVNKEAIP